MYRDDQDGWNTPIDTPTGGGAGAYPSQGGTANLATVIAQLYRTALGREASPDEVNQWANGGMDLASIQQAIYNSDEAKAYNTRQQQTATPPPAGPPPGGGAPPPTGGGAPPAGSIGAMDPSAVFQPPAPATGMPSWMPAAPAAPGQFEAPAFKQAPAYAEPDYDAAMKDPGFQNEIAMGRQAMEQSAAARGVLNGGGTLKDINAWGQNLGAQRVNDVKDRSVNNYLLNYQTQYVDPYKYAYQSALDKFTGSLNIWQGQNSQYQTNAQVAQRAGEDAWQQAYTPFNDLWNRRLTVGLA